MASDVEVTAKPDAESATDSAAENPSGKATPSFHSQLTAKWVLTASAFSVVVILCGLFLLFSYFPLRGTDLWLHVNYGGWILEHGSLPAFEVFVPLAEGMPVVDSAWLSQVILAAVHAKWGPHALSALFAITMFGGYLMLARTYYLETERAFLVAVGLLLTLVVGWSRMATIRPENFAFLAFAVMLWMIFGHRQTDPEVPDPPAPSWKLWIAAPVLMALWANLHGSFICGLAVLGSCALGRMLETAWKERSLAGLISDRGTWQWLMLFQLSALATLINPYGLDLWLYTMGFASEHNLQNIVEWQPLLFKEVGGREYAVSIVVLLVTLRWSRQRMTATSVVLLAVFGVAPLFGIRMLGWYAPVLAVVILPHWEYLLNQVRPDFGKSKLDPNAPAPAGVNAWKYTLFSGLFIWIAFAMSPFSHPVTGTKLRAAEKLYEGDSTPLALTAWLKENPTTGQVFHPQEWGDWLIREVPGDFQPFVTSNIHAIPTSVWSDYLKIYHHQTGWVRALDRYNVTTLIFDKKLQPAWKSILRGDEEWALRYEDDQALVYVRKDSQSPRPVLADKEAEAEG